MRTPTRANSEANDPETRWPKRSCRQAKAGYVNTTRRYEYFAKTSAQQHTNVNLAVRNPSRSHECRFRQTTLRLFSVYRLLSVSLQSVREWLLNLLTAPTATAPPTRYASECEPSDWYVATNALPGVVTFLQRALSQSFTVRLSGVSGR